MNAPPSSGTMTVTTTGGGEPIGMVMKDTFDLTCSGWVDDVSDLPLIYRCHVASRHVGRNKCAALSGFTITPPSLAIWGVKRACDVAFVWNPKPNRDVVLVRNPNQITRASVHASEVAPYLSIGWRHNFTWLAIQLRDE